MQDNTNDKELVLQAMREYGRSKAAQLQEASAEMTGTELYAEDDYIPDFQAAKAVMNMNQRKVGEKDGFLCRSTAGHVVRLIGSYDSNVWPGEPETLLSQWKFVWAKDPKKARPFLALSTSPYDTGDCCTYPAEDGVDHVYRSGQDGNVWPPRTLNVQWTDLGPVGGPFVEEEA